MRSRPGGKFGFRVSRKRRRRGVDLGEFTTWHSLVLRGEQMGEGRRKDPEQKIGPGIPFSSRLGMNVRMMNVDIMISNHPLSLE